jgi:hypothetical protein
MAIHPGNCNTDEVEAAVENRGICRWINSVVPGAAVKVLQNGPAANQPGIYYDLQIGDVVFVKQICYGVLSNQDSCDFDLGYTDGPAGSGTFTSLTMKFGQVTGNPKEGKLVEERPIAVPLAARYSDGARSITIRVDANDAAAEVRCGWTAYIEKEDT